MSKVGLVAVLCVALAACGGGTIRIVDENGCLNTVLVGPFGAMTHAINCEWREPAP